MAGSITINDGSVYAHTGDAALLSYGIYSKSTTTIKGGSIALSACEQSTTKYALEADGGITYVSSYSDFRINNTSVTSDNCLSQSDYSMPVTIVKIGNILTLSTSADDSGIN